MLVQIGLTSTYILRFKIEKLNGNLYINDVIEIIFYYRALSRAYNDPIFACIESIILFWESSPWTLIALSFCLNRAILLLRKTSYIMISVYTAIKNKK
jgi:hypothetical protein